MAFDAGRKVGVLFGGQVSEGKWVRSGDTWTWNGSAWSKVEGSGPPPMSHCFMAPNPKGNGVVLFGGKGENAASDQTWAFTDAGWSELHPAHKPSPRSGVTGALHAASAQVVIFGGSETSGSALADTWVWDGTDWRQIETPKGPPARIGGAACYDPIRKQVVAFGGWTKAGALTDTWLWNGETWVAADAGYHPLAMQSSVMVFDATTATAMLIGYATGEQYTSWSWNGETWARLPRSLAPSRRTGFAMTEMGPEQPAVLFGGGDTIEHGDTWTLRGAEWTPMLVATPKVSGQTLSLLSRRGRSHDDRCIQDGLNWLCAHQDGDGRWDCDQFMKLDRDGEATDGAGREHYDVGVTGLALLALLADTESIKGYAREDAIRRGLDWLIAQQQDNGLIGTTNWSLFIYGHAIATWVLSEACLMTPDPAVRQAAQRAADYLEQHRNPYGAWRYQPRDNDNDTSVTGWCAMALAMADRAGLTTNPDALVTALVWFDSTCDATGRQGYQRKGEGSARLSNDHAQKFPTDKSEAMTAIALACRFFLGQKKGVDRQVKPSADTILSKLPVWDPRSGSIDIYYWYWASMAMAQYGAAYDDRWRIALTRALRTTQRTDGSFHGSWDPLCAWGEEGGRIYMTAMAVLSLQAPNRYVPWSQVTPLPDKPIYAPANQAFAGRKFALFQSLLDQVQTANPNQPEVKVEIAGAQISLDTELERAMKVFESIRVSRDFEGGPDRLRVLADEFGSLAPGVAATNLLAEWKTDPTAKRELEATEQYKRLAQKLREATNPNTEASIRRELERCAKRYAGTKAAKLMETLLGVKR